MIKKIVSADEAGKRPFTSNREGDVVFYFESVKEAAEHIGESCCDPNGDVHPLYSVCSDGYVECPKDFKYLAVSIRLENFESGETKEEVKEETAPVEEVK